jgi:hypothetical protein
MNFNPSAPNVPPYGTPSKFVHAPNFNPQTMQNMGALAGQAPNMPPPQFGAPPVGEGQTAMPPMAPGEDEETAKKRRSAIADMLRSMGKGGGIGMMAGAALGGANGNPMAGLAGAALGAGAGYLMDQYGRGGNGGASGGE